MGDARQDLRVCRLCWSRVWNEGAEIFKESSNPVFKRSAENELMFQGPGGTPKGNPLIVPFVTST